MPREQLPNVRGPPRAVAIGLGFRASGDAPRAVASGDDPRAVPTRDVYMDDAEQLLCEMGGGDICLA